MSERHCLLFNRDIPYRLTAAERQAIESASPGIEIVEIGGTAATPPEVLAKATILVTDLALPPDLASCPRLCWVQLVSAGANQVTHHPLAGTGIPVTTASGLHGVPIGQFVTGALLMLVHHFREFDASQAQRRWPADRWSLRGSLLRGATAGVLGYGSIGRECARQLHALGMNIVAIDPGEQRDAGFNFWPGTGDATGALPTRWFKPPQLRDMLPLCDVLVVAAPLTPHTEGIIGVAELALMPKDARVIIISRGGIVQEDALVAALKSRHLAGAAVDCYVQEPPPATHPFYDAPNLVMTPHMAGAFEGFWPAMIGLFTENLRRFQASQPLLNRADKRLGF